MQNQLNKLKRERQSRLMLSPNHVLSLDDYFKQEQEKFKEKN